MVGATSDVVPDTSLVPARKDTQNICQYKLEKVNSLVDLL